MTAGVASRVVPSVRRKRVQTATVLGDTDSSSRHNTNNTRNCTTRNDSRCHRMKLPKQENSNSLQLPA